VVGFGLKYMVGYITAPSGQLLNGSALSVVVMIGMLGYGIYGGV
jgi:hypothetical protein